MSRPGRSPEEGRAAPGRRVRRKAATRSALVEAGLALVKARGLFATRIEDITERCDVAKGVFYNYFDSKDALYAELLARGVDLLEHDYLAGAADLADPAARIRAVARAHGRFFGDRPEYALLFHQGRGLLQLAGGGEPLQATYRDYLRRLAAVALPDAPGLTAERRLDLAALLAGAVAGHRSFQGSAGLLVDGLAAEEALALAIPALLAGDRAGPGRGPAPA